MKCQAKDCKCHIEARPFKIECDDGAKFMGCFCPCHSVALYLVVLDYDPEAEIEWIGKRNA
jgi:hypothetical protein